MKHLIGITSPPYEEAISSTNWEEQKKRIQNLMKEGKASKELIRIYNQICNGNAHGELAHYKSQYSSNPENIGNLKHQPQELNFDITQYHKCGGDMYWHGCYGSETHYRQFVTPESYAHPAKASFLLIDRIFKHLEHLGLLKKGMTICDFMAGSGRIPLVASLKGYDSVGVELEPHFIKMCQDNKKFAENKAGRNLNFEIVQGDSRQLSKILNKGDVGITSPPFEQSTHSYKDNDYQKKFIEVAEKKWGKNRVRSIMTKDTQGYGNNPSNIGNLPYKEMVGVVSPPFQDAISSEKDGIDWHKSKFQPERDRSSELSWQLNYSQNPQNIGNLKDAGFVGITSPPYESADDMFHDIDWINKNRPRPSNPESNSFKEYNKNKKNLSNQQGQSYLSAMLQVYQEAYKSGMQVIATITKNPTRQGKLRRLDLDTAKLIEMSGFKIVDYHRAVLFKTTEQATLTGSTKKEHKGRLSFFKRLSIAKGNLASQWEDVIIGVKT